MGQQLPSLVHTIAKVVVCVLMLMKSGFLAASDKSQADFQGYYVTENKWQLGLALGVGGRTNPLVDGDAIPLVILPDVAYYAESFYFDNGELGTQFFPTNNLSIDMYIAPNAERANFSFWHTANIFSSAASNIGAIDSTSDSMGPPFSPQISVDDIGSRKWAIDAYARVQWHAKHHHIQVRVGTDISRVHNGLSAGAEYRYSGQFNGSRISISPFVQWMSAALTDYYYGIDERDTLVPMFMYQANAGWQYGIKINASRPINEHWQWVSWGSYKKLHSGMTNSPLVEKAFVVSAFVGVAYRF